MVINSLICVMYHLDAYHNKFSFKEYMEIRRLKKLTRQMEMDQKKCHALVSKI